jgi:hypothetical protein
MAVTTKKAVLWRKEVGNRPAALADSLESLAAAGADLKFALGYAMPGGDGRAVVEVYPVTGKKAVGAAQGAGFSASSNATLVVEGDNKPGLGHAIAKAIGDAGINLTFVTAQVIGRRYSAVFGFETDADAARASALIRKAAPAKKR